MLAQRKVLEHIDRTVPANDNRRGRRVVVNLPTNMPINAVETEVFDYLIGSFSAFAANDNEHHDPNPGEIRGPPSYYSEKHSTD